MQRRNHFGRRAKRRGAGGFSLLELAIVVGIIVLIGGVAVMKLGPAMQSTHVTNAYETTMMALRRAREQAVAERRTYLVTINPAGSPAGTITLTQVDSNTVTTTVNLPSDVSFDAETGIPNPGPDGFGAGASTGAIDLDASVGTGGANTVYFEPDGSAQDANGNINNGVVYLARPGDIQSSRAITLYGATGRLRGWRLLKNASSGVYSWDQI